MELTFQYWFLFPVAMVVATIAMTSGIGGAVFFSPIFILFLGLEPAVAIGTALITEFFGFSSGMYGYAKAKLIDFKLGINLLIFSIPAAFLGSLYADRLPPIVLKAIFAAGLIFIGSQLFLSWRKEEKEKADKDIVEDSIVNYESHIIDKTGREFKYTVCKKSLGRVFAAVGGAFVGMISVGLAELQEYHLIAKCRIPSPVAVATSIFVVVVTVLAASTGHFYNFFVHSEPGIFKQIINIIIFTIPGVIIGGQIGPHLQMRLNPDLVKIFISFLFLLIGIILIVTLV